MTKYKKTFLILSTLTITLGVGCIQTEPVTTNNNSSSAANTHITNINLTNTAVAQNNTNNNINQESDNTVDISDWQTYTNEEYGFSFKYPRDWKVNIEETQSKSWILPDGNIYVIQLLLHDKIKLVILPEGQFDHDLEQDMKEIGLTVDNKSVTLAYSDSYQVYAFNGYPQKDSEFRTESHANDLKDQTVIEAIVMSIDFSS